jgi:polyhydroxyalkanoate synthesis repressor PhaR
MPEPGARVIRRYGNRRLYDARLSRCVTMEEIAGFVRAGEDVRVVDADTGADLTNRTLVQLILEEHNRGHLELLPTALLRAILSARRETYASWLEQYLSAGAEWLDRALKQVVPATAATAGSTAASSAGFGFPFGGVGMGGGGPGAGAAQAFAAIPGLGAIPGFGGFGGLGGPGGMGGATGFPGFGGVAPSGSAQPGQPGHPGQPVAPPPVSHSDSYPAPADEEDDIARRLDELQRQMQDLTRRVRRG